MFIEKLNKLLLKNNVTRAKLIEDIGIGKNQIKYWEVHQNTPNAETIKKIADYFGVTVEYLIGDEDYPDSSEENDEKKELLNRIGQMDEDQLRQLNDFADYLIGKKK